jgi:[ribosomal protein S5]-alanine N-acetyltransferase
MLGETPRLWLKPLQVEDLDTFHSILTDKFVRTHLTDDRELSCQQSEEMLGESLRMFAQEGVGLWLMVLKQDCQTGSKIEEPTIGLVGLWYFFGESQPQLIYALLPQWTGRGFATEAAQAIINYCFDFFGFDYLIACGDRHNLASQRVALRLGMKIVEEKIIEDKPILFFRLNKA